MFHLVSKEECEVIIAYSSHFLTSYFIISQIIINATTPNFIKGDGNEDSSLGYRDYTYRSITRNRYQVLEIVQGKIMEVKRI